MISPMTSKETRALEKYFLVWVREAGEEQIISGIAVYFNKAKVARDMA